MLLALLQLLPRAHAALTEEDLTRLLADVRPGVEAATGRTLSTTPTLRIDDGMHVQQRLADLIATRLAGPGPITESIRERAMAEAEQRTDGLAAVWIGPEHSIYFVSSHLRKILDMVNAPPAALEPFVRCVFAHELTHAVQDEHLRVPVGTPAEAPNLRALLEGQAELVADEVCSPDIHGLALDLSGRNAGLKDDDQGRVDYGFGPVFVGAWARRYGATRLWDMYARGLPTLADIEEVGRKLSPAGWADTGPMDTSIQALAPEPDVETRARRTSALPLLVPLAPGTLQVPVTSWSTATRMVSLASGDHRGALLMMLLNDDAAGPAWLDRRISSSGVHGVGELRRLGGLSLGTPEVTVGEAHLTRPTGARTLTLRTAGGGFNHYVEAWATRGRRLVGLSVQGDEVEGAVDAALDRMLDAPRDDTPTAASVAAAEKILSRYAPR